MFVNNNNKFGKDLIIIHPGEYYVSSDNEIIGTILGSCVAIALIDEKNKIAGMNHFMLPGKISQKDIFSDQSARYGITAIQQLIFEIEKRGSEKKFLIAKIFGGGHILEYSHDTSRIPIDNIRLAKIMMEMEDIPITAIDGGDTCTRKILLDVNSGTVYLKKMRKATFINKIAEQEITYVKKQLHSDGRGIPQEPTT